MARADGDAGARRAAAFLGIAACAETTAASLSEDWAKVDLKMGFRHAFRPGKTITVHAQVKSGQSFELSSSTTEQISLGIDKETRDALSGPGMPGLVVWVPPAPRNRVYWWAADSREGKSLAKFSRNQFVRPSIRYDLTRLYEYASWTKRFESKTVSMCGKAEVLPRAKAAYAALKAGTWIHPLCGQLAITRLAWRHITRRSKSEARRTIALRAATQLRAFLDKAPDRIVVLDSSLQDRGHRTYEQRYILCWYRKALNIDGESHSLMLRIQEDISYPKNWQNQPLGLGDITHKATLASWWCKKDKKAK